MHDAAGKARQRTPAGDDPALARRAPIPVHLVHPPNGVRKRIVRLTHHAPIERFTQALFGRLTMQGHRIEDGIKVREAELFPGMTRSGSERLSCQERRRNRRDFGSRAILRDQGPAPFDTFDTALPTDGHRHCRPRTAPNHRPFLKRDENPPKWLKASHHAQPDEPAGHPQSQDLRRAVGPCSKSHRRLARQHRRQNFKIRDIAQSHPSTRKRLCSCNLEFHAAKFAAADSCRPTPAAPDPDRAPGIAEDGTGHGACRGRPRGSAERNLHQVRAVETFAEVSRDRPR